MKTYNNEGLCNSYDKKHKERDSLDYYSTPIAEVTKILNQLITYMGNLKISFDKDKNEGKLLDFHTAKFNSKELYSEYLDKLVHEIEQGYSYIIDNYLKVFRTILY